jgi:transposase InsO family protein
MEENYHELKKKLRSQTRKSRDSSLRVKVNLILECTRIGNVSLACKRMGLSPKSYYRWIERLREGNWKIEALREHSRRPLKSPKKISETREDRIRYFAKRGYGSRMIEAMMRRENLPVHRSTICHVLNGRKKLKKKRRIVLKAHRKRYELHIPGQRIQMDVKYVPNPVAEKRAFNYVAVDECTRWRFAKAYDKLCPESTIDFIKELVRACPFPITRIQSDHGIEFTWPGNSWVHPCEWICHKLGIEKTLIPVGAKELNGKVERSHRIDEQYFYWKAPTVSIESFNRSLKLWIGQYNRIRPHGGLNFLTPMQKLRERYETLQKEKFEDKKLENLRLKFLESDPTKKEQRKVEQQIKELEKMLNDLNHAA